MGELLCEGLFVSGCRLHCYRAFSSGFEKAVALTTICYNKNSAYAQRTDGVYLIVSC